MSTSAETALRFSILYGNRIKRGITKRTPLGPMTRDITGDVFTRLTVLHLVRYDKHRRPVWLCQCACGRKCLASSATLRGARVRSCGCLRDEKARVSMLALHAKRRAA